MMDWYGHGIGGWGYGLADDPRYGQPGFSPGLAELPGTPAECQVW